MEDKKYKVGNETYNIPESQSQEFLKDFPKAVELERFVVDKDEYDIPVNERDAFIKDFPSAKSQKKNTATAEQSVSVAAKPKFKLPEGYVEPEWFTQSGFDYKEDHKIRSKAISRIIAGGIMPLPGRNRAEEITPIVDESDILTPEMVSEVDAFGNTDISTAASNVKAFREQMKEKYNPTKSKITDRNIDILLEEKLSPKLAKEIDAALGKLSTVGKSKRDVVLADPEMIKSLKEEYRGKGWSGDIVDQAFSKSIDSQANNILEGDQLAAIAKTANDIAKKTGRKYEDVQLELGEETEKDRIEYATSLFGKPELERRKLVTELEFLKKNPEKNLSRIAETESRIKEIQSKLQLDVNIDWGGTIVNALIDPLKRPQVAHRFTYGMYDENGNKTIHGKMSEEEKTRQSEISAKMDEVKEIGTTKEAITKQSQKTYMVLQNLKAAKKQVENEIEERLRAIDKTGIGAVISQLSPTHSPEAISIMTEGKRRLDRIAELNHNAEIDFEALSRMELLNVDVAMQDKTIGYYLGEAGKVIVNKNNTMLFKDVVSNAEQVDATRKLYQEMGIQMDEEELKNTAPDLMMDITRAGTELTDFALKAMAFDKVAGVNGMLALTAKLKRTGAVERLAASFFEKSAQRLKAAGKIKAATVAEEVGFEALHASTKAVASKVVANVAEASAEGLKFAAISEATPGSEVGGFESGLAFYEVGKLMPNFRLANKYVNVLMNGFVKSSSAMTISMEAVAAYDVARNAIANDNDFEKAMEENGIIGWGDKDEVFRRVMVEMITAVPFGLRSLTTLRDGGFSSTTYEDVKHTIKKLREIGKHEEANQLEMALASNISPEGSKIAFKMKDQISYLQEQGRYDPTKKLEKNLEEYELMVQELGYDPISDQMYEAHEGKMFGVSAINEVVSLHEKIEFLKKRKIDMAHNNAVDIENKFQAEKSKDADIQTDIVTSVLKMNGTPTPRVVTKEQKDLADIKKEISSTKKDEVDWDKFSKDTGAKVRDVFNRLRDRIGESNFMKTLNEAVGMTSVTYTTSFEKGKVSKSKLFELIPKEGFKDKEVFDAFVDTMQSMRSDDRKQDAIDRVEFLKDVVDRMERVANPERGYVETITNRPSMENLVTLPEMTLLKEQIKSFKKGSEAGRKELREKLKQVQEFIKANSGTILESLKNTKLKEGELSVLTEPLIAEASDEVVLDRINRLSKVISRLENRAVQSRIKETISGMVSRTTKGGEVKAGSVDFVTATKVNAVKILLGAKTDKAKESIARLESLLDYAKSKGNAFEVDLYQAQINALRTTGYRDIALDRIAELTDKGVENLNRSELMELELLEFNDMSKMTRLDLLGAERNLNMMQRYGTSIREMQEMNRQIYVEAEVQAAIEASGFTKEQIKAGIANKIYSKRGSKEEKSTVKNVIEAITKFRENQESFFTLMEFAMRDTPGRAPMEGYFHSITHDIYRARQEKESSLRKMKAAIASNQARIFGVKTSDLKNIKKIHSEKQKIQLTVDGRKSDVKGSTKSGKTVFREMTVNQAYKLWQATLMESNNNAFRAMGLGVKGVVNGEIIYDAELLRTELQDFIEKFSPVGSKVIDYARWQVEVLFPMYYPRLNEAHRNRNGVDMLYETNYSPNIRLMEGEDMATLSKSILEGDSKFFVQSMLPGYLKAKSKNPFVEINTEIDGDAFIDAYVEKMEHFLSFQPVIDRMEYVFGNKNVKTALAVNNTAEMNDLISGYIDRLKTDRTPLGTTRIDKAIDFFKRNIVMSKLGFNISLLPKQMTALPAFMHALNPSEMGSFAAHLIPNRDFIETFKKLAKSDFAINRVTTGSSERDFKEVITKLEQRATHYEKEGVGAMGRLWTKQFAQDMLIATKLGDISTVLIGGQAVFRIKRDKYLKQGMSLKEAEKKAYEDFVIASSLTQASANVEDLSAFQSMGSAGKMLTLFQNNSLQYLRIEVEALTNMHKAATRMQEMDKNDPNYALEKSRFANGAKDLLIYHFLLPALFQAAIKRFYIGDDEMMDDPDMFISMGLGSAAYVFMLGQVVKAMVEVATSGRTYGVQLAGVIEGVSKDFNKAIETVNQVLSDDPITEKDVFERMLPTAKPMLSTIGNLTGAPLVPMSNLAKGAYDYISGKSSDVGDLFGYSAQGTGSGDRSPDFRLMNKYLENGDKVYKFLDGVRDQFTEEDFRRNKGRLTTEYNMYQHFGGYDPIVNHLYRSRLSNEEKAEYLLRIKNHKFTAPMSINAMIQTKTMTDEKFKDLINELNQYGVISREVVMLMNNMERENK